MRSHPCTAGGSAGRRAASKASIKTVLHSYGTQIVASERHLETTVSEYRTSKDETAVEAAISEELSLLRAMRTTVKAQSAGGHPLVRLGKDELIAGLKAYIAADEHLAKLFAVLTTSRSEAKKEFAHYRHGIARAVLEIRAGVRALSH
jgi:hypothetical protein